MKYIAFTDVDDDDDYKVSEFHGDSLGFVGIMNLISELDDGDVLVLKCYDEDLKKGVYHGRNT